MGLAFLLSARQVGREHVVVPYREDWKPLREEGFAAYARRISGPYTGRDDAVTSIRSGRPGPSAALNRVRR